MASVLTHNGEITLTNPKTGNHRTFKIETVKDGPLAGKRILSMLIGPDNTKDYLGIAFVELSGIYVWKKHRNTLYEETAKCLLKIEKLGLISQFSTRCRVCDRKLTTPRSISLGIGPICEKES